MYFNLVLIFSFLGENLFSRLMIAVIYAVSLYTEIPVLEQIQSTLVYLTLALAWFIRFKLYPIHNLNYNYL